MNQTEKPHKSIVGDGSTGLAKGQFQNTRWTLVQRSRGDDRESEEALELCRTYWYPVYAFVRRSGRSVEDAEDLTQGFFERIIARGDFGAADEGRGRLRSYLIGALKNHMANQWQRESAKKRGGGQAPESLEGAEEQYGLEPSHELTPDRLYERRWALALLSRVLERLRSEYEARDKVEMFAVLEKFLAWNSGESYADAGAQLGMSEGAAKVAVFRMRRRYRALMIEEIAHTVDSEDEIEGEMRDLMAVFG